MAVETTRRDFILGAVMTAIAAAGVTGFPSALFAAAPVTPEAFLGFSERVTQKSDLDPDVAKAILGGFLATGHGDALAQLIADQVDSFTPLADAVVAAWYSGLVTTKAEGGDGTEQVVADFTGALVWEAMTFTKPFAECGGETGYWADPPEA
ncbi:MAG: hypothetical protein J0H08_17595 [Rhizobiales bacterium]|nr:hypothetical protein [Hyphomicrobiales bacterium]